MKSLPHQPIEILIHTMNNTTNQKLICIQINIQGLSDNSNTCLEKYAFDSKADIIAIQETKRPKGPHFKGFSTINSTSIGTSGGTALMFRNKKFKSINQIHDFDSPSSFCTWVIVTIENYKYLFCNCYIQKDNLDILSEFLDQMKKAKDYCIKYNFEGLYTFGDFNARHTSWGDHVSSNSGKFLYNFIQSNNFHISSPQTNTFLCNNGGSVIDLCLYYSKNSPENLYPFIDDEIILGSGAPFRGHVPVISQISTPFIQPTSKSVYDLKNCNWNTFAKSVDTYLEIHFNENADPREMLKIINDSIEYAKKNVLTTKTISCHSKPYWNPRLSELSREVRLAKRNFKRFSTFSNELLLKEKLTQFNKELAQSIDEWLYNSAETLNLKEQSSFWQRHKRLFQKDSRDNKVEILREGDKLIIDDAEKALHLKKSFIDGEHLNDCVFDQNHFHMVENYTDSIHPENSTEEQNNLEINRLFELTELDKAISSFNINIHKSMDNLECHPLMFHFAGRKLKAALLILFNSCFANNIWPWNCNKMIFLKKPNKSNYASAGNYRPICIGPYMAKLFEKMIYSRLMQYFRQNNLIEFSQEGFLPSRSTARYLYSLTGAIHKNLINNKFCLTLLADFSKAFDSVWSKGLLYKLHSKGIVGNMWFLLRSFLCDRKIYIHFDNYNSPYYECILGLPQGAILSPLLFIFYIHDMFSSMPSITSRIIDDHSLQFKYADDLSAHIFHENLNGLLMETTKISHLLTEWCNKWRLKINCDTGKSEAIAHNFCTHETNFPNIILQGKEIKYVDKSPVLGVTIDKKLEWKNHSSLTLSRCWSSWLKIKKFCSKYRGFKTGTILFLVNCSVMSRLLYCAPVWLKSSYDAFNKLLYDILTTAAGVSFKPDTTYLQCLLNFPPLSIQCDIYTVKFLAKNICLNENHSNISYRYDLLNYYTINHPFIQDFNNLKKFLAYKLYNNINSRRNINLLDNCYTDLANYKKDEILQFRNSLWNSFLININCNVQAPYSSGFSRNIYSRNIESLCNSLILNRVGNLFKSKVNPHCPNTCHTCNVIENADHILFTCINIPQHLREVIINVLSSLNLPFVHDFPLMNVNYKDFLYSLLLEFCNSINDTYSIFR